MKFIHENHPQRIRFESGGAAQAVADEIDALGSKRPMLIAAHADADMARRVTAGIPIAVTHHDVAMHVPIEVAQRARTVAGEHNVDGLICIGGGSTTGLAKAVALTTGLPIVAVPTTYAGSEATPVWGLTEGERKTTGVDPVVLPRAIVYDATLTLTLTVDMSVASGLNAVAHCVDSLWAPAADPINAALAIEGVRALRIGLPQVAQEPDGLRGREDAFYGTYLAAAAFASAGSGLHHKICHVLGGMYNLPHAQTHATVLPYVLALNAPAVPDAAERIASAFGATDALAGLQALKTELRAPRALRDYGFEPSGIPAAVDAILPLVPASNPTTVTADDLAALLRAAWEGSEPR